MSASMRPHRWQPTRLPSPWDSQGKNTGVGCHFLLQCMKAKSESEVAQSCLTLSDLMDCSLPGSSIHGIFQARVLEWGAIAFSNAIPTHDLTRACCLLRVSLCVSPTHNLQGSYENIPSNSICTYIMFLKRSAEYNFLCLIICGILKFFGDFFFFFCTLMYWYPAVLIHDQPTFSFHASEFFRLPWWLRQ